MFNSLSLFIGWRYVRRHHSHGFARFISASSVIGIALGVMVLIIVQSAMNGFEQELSIKLLSIVPHAEIITVDNPLNNWPKAVERAEQHDHVIAAAPLIKMTGLIQKGSQLKALEIHGVDPVLETHVSAINHYITHGKWENITQKNGLIIGSGIAKKLALQLGDKVQLLLPRQHQKHEKRNQFSAPIKRNVTIVGIFNFGGTIDDTLAYMSLDQAAKIIGLAPIKIDNGQLSYQVHGIRLKVDNIYNAPKIARAVAYDFNQYAYIYDWTYTQGHLFSDIQLVRMVMFIVLALVIAVASFNIVSTLVMAVNEKKGDIAILLTMGTNSGTIMRIFMVQGIFNGVVGCLIGSLIGIVVALNLTPIVTFIEQLFNTHLLSKDIYFIDFIPSQLRMVDVIVTVVIALILSLLATLFPAWQATKVQPAKVLGQI